MIAALPHGVLGAAMFALAALSRGGVPRRATAIFGLGWAAGAATWLVLRALRVGTPDVWGDANTIGITVGALSIAVGLFGLGTWLRSERPATVAGPDNPPSA